MIQIEQKLMNGFYDAQKLHIDTILDQTLVHIWTPYFLVDKTHQNLYFCYMSKHPKLNENSQFFLVFTCPVSHPNLSCPSSSTLLVGSFALLSTVDCIVRKRTHIRIETRLWHYVCHSSNPLLQRRLFALENPISVLLRFCFLFFFSKYFLQDHFKKRMMYNNTCKSCKFL